jgi:hypothetical protein
MGAEDVQIPIKEHHELEHRHFVLDAILTLSQQENNPKKGIVVFAHGSSSGRHSPRNQYVASILNNSGIATLLVDLLTEEEQEIDEKTREHRFNIKLLANRLCARSALLLLLFRVCFYPSESD